MDFKSIYKNGNIITKLIFINIVVFAVVKLVSIAFLLFNISTVSLLPYLAMPAEISTFLMRFWTAISYMFLHEEFFHLFFNMMCLYWFGKIALSFLNEKQLIGLYLLGGIMGGALYLISYNLFPFYEQHVGNSLLLGASGAIMAIMVATAMLAPNMEMMLMLIGRVKLKYVAMATVLISLFGITGGNAGGELAHLGGALAGYIYVSMYRGGKDISLFFTRIFDTISGLFTPKMKQKKTKFHYQAPMNDADFNQRKAKKSANVDAILDKIKRSGYESLTPDEKQKLFEK